jgi:hypothetical protein
MTVKIHSVHTITSSQPSDFTFSPQQYSKLKFGCDDAAKQFGIELANSFFHKHVSMLLANNCVVIPSPYNHVRNAASVMTDHFVNQLNHLLVNVNGSHVQTSIIHRKVTYTADYGFLAKEHRKKLIGNDEFYLNTGFLKDKVLLFIDDVRITGTHEDVLVKILNDQNIKNKAFYLYYAMVDQESEIDPSIEAKINFAGMADIDSFVKLTDQPNYNVIVRPIKYLLGLHIDQLSAALPKISIPVLTQVYNGCLGEGYYKNPAFQSNFQYLKKHIENRR